MAEQEIIVVRPQQAIVSVVVAPPKVIETGIQGEPGRNSDISRLPFSFGDASPKPIAVINAGQTVFTVQIVLQVPFNGIGSALCLGDAQLSDRLIRADQNDPYTIAEYETNPGYTYLTDTPIALTITAGEGCTQGSGYLLFEV